MAKFASRLSDEEVKEIGWIVIRESTPNILNWTKVFKGLSDEILAERVKQAVVNLSSSNVKQVVNWLTEKVKQIPITVSPDILIFFLAPYSAILFGGSESGEQWLKKHGDKLDPELLGKKPEDMKRFIGRLSDMGVEVRKSQCVIAVDDRKQ